MSYKQELRGVVHSRLLGVLVLRLLRYVLQLYIMHTVLGVAKGVLAKSAASARWLWRRTDGPAAAAEPPVVLLGHAQREQHPGYL